MMGSPQIFVLCCWVFSLLAVNAQFPHEHTAGASLWSVSLQNSNVTPPTQWITIPQTFQKEWDALANCFTVELWVYWRGPTPGISQEVIISRHPGENYEDTRAHFGIGLVPSSKNSDNWNVNAWSGCYVALGYDLNSIRAFSGSSDGFTIKPGQWHHIAFVVGGDGTFLKNAVGRLFVQGDVQDSNFWNEKGCGKWGVPWHRQGWATTQANDVRLGWYDNQAKDALSTGNPNSILGFNGLVDEIALWTRARTPDEVFRAYTLSTEYGGHEPDLIAYYQLNEIHFAPFPYDGHLGKKKNTTLYHRASIENHWGPLGWVVPNSNSQWVNKTGLRIGQRILVLGKGLTQPRNILAHGELLSSTNVADTPVFSIISVSPDLAPKITKGTIRLYHDDLPGPITLANLPLNLSSPYFSVAADCENAACVTIGNLFFSFTANGNISHVRIEVLHPCPNGVLDSCGVCNGDNSSCTCTCYHGFRSSFLNQQLLLASIERVRQKINRSLEFLQQVTARVESIRAAGKLTAAQSQMVANILTHKKYHTCHNTYCAALQPWQSAFEALLPLPEPAGLPYDGCSCVRDRDPANFS